MSIEKIKAFAKKHKRNLLWGAFIAVVLITTQAFDSVEKAKEKADVKELTGLGAEMRKTPKLWFKQEKDLSAAIANVRANEIAAAGVAEDSVLISTKKGEKYFVADGRYAMASSLVLNSYKTDTTELFPVIFLTGISHARPEGPSSALVGIEVIGRIIYSVFLIAMVVGLFSFIRKNKSTKFELAKKTDLRFTDVIGASEAKAALQDVVAYLKDPAAFADLGGKPSHGVLMVGPPGTGKTQLAKAVAGECGVSFIAITGSDFSSKFYGGGIDRIKALFKLARASAPCLVFIDEIDGIGKRSTSSEGPVVAESNRIINQMLVEMDGFKAGDGVIVIGATNLVDMLDEAMLREGRFDRRVHLKMPALQERKQLFELYSKKYKVTPNLDYEQCARLTTGMSPAAIANIMNQAALLASNQKHAEVTQAVVLESIERTRMGAPDDGSRAMSEIERERVAVHEAGHAFVEHLQNSGRVEKVTILPRGGALGVTLVTQNEDKYLQLKSELEKRIVTLLGGRCAEILFYGEASTGASQDLKEASRIALAMVTQFGFGSSGSLFSIAAVPDSVLSQQEVANGIAEATEMLATYEKQCMELLASVKPAIELFKQRILLEETVSGEAVAESILAAKDLKLAA